MDNPPLTRKCSRHDCKNLVPIDGPKNCERCKVANKKHKAAEQARKKLHLTNAGTEKQASKKRRLDQEMEDSGRPTQCQKICHNGLRASSPSRSDDEDNGFFNNKSDESVSPNKG